MKVLIFGSSTNPERYSYKASEMLLQYGHEIVQVGRREGHANDHPILAGHPKVDQIDTLTLYMNPTALLEHQDYLIGLEAKRVIFNPGTESAELAKAFKENGSEVLNACTLVMLRTNQF